MLSSQRLLRPCNTHHTDYLAQHNHQQTTSRSKYRGPSRGYCSPFRRILSSDLRKGVNCDHCKFPMAETWDLCLTSGDYLWLEDDSILLNCMIDLHHRQSTKCISVAGSRCEAVRGTSKIDLVEMTYTQYTTWQASSRTLDQSHQQRSLSLDRLHRLQIPVLANLMPNPLTVPISSPGSLESHGCFPHRPQQKSAGSVCSTL